MADLQYPSETPRNEGNQAYANQVRAFIFTLNFVSKKVHDIESNLRESYPQQGLKDLSRQFEMISKAFTNISFVRTDPRYAIINRSQDRLRLAKAVASEARNLAMLFEKYSHNPKTYSAVNSRIQINKLSAQLKNLIAASSLSSAR